MAQDPYKAEHDNDARREQLRAVFGDDIFQGLATDQPAANRRPLGQRVVQERRRQQRQANQERQMAIMREALAVQNKADAYARVVDNARNRHPSSPSDLAAAALHAVEQGIVQPPSTITRLMDQARAAREYQPMGS